jgi:hypothetical protein
MIPVELSSSIKAVALYCPLRNSCGRVSSSAKKPANLYYNRFNKQCKSFLGDEIVEILEK